MSPGLKVGHPPSRTWTWDHKVRRIQQWHWLWVATPVRNPDLDHRSEVFRRILDRFGLSFAGLTGEALSNAGLSFLGGAPRNPNLKPGAGPEYSTVRLAESQYAYATISTEKHYCLRCGWRTLEQHHLAFHDDEGSVTKTGYAEGCSHCDAEGWMFKTHGPRTTAARKRAEKIVP